MCEGPKGRQGIELFGSAANVQYTMHVGVGEPAGAPTQTVDRLEKALRTLQGIERFPWDHHVSFAVAWLMLSRGVVHSVDCDFRLVPRMVMVPLQRRLQVGLRQTLATLIGGPVSGLIGGPVSGCI